MHVNHLDNHLTSPALPEPIAIIGMACRLPGAMDTESLWKMLMGGETAWGAAPDDRFDRTLYLDPGPQRVTRSYTDLAALMPSLEVQHPSLDKLQRFERRFDIAHQIFLEQTCRACEDAGMDPFDIRAGQRTGVYVGHTGGSTRIGDLVYATRMGEVARLLRETGLAQRLGADRTSSLIQALTAEVRQRYGHREFNELNAYGALDCARVVREALALDGPAVVFDAACASGLQALAVAVRALRSGRIDQAIVGAVSHFKSDSLVLFSSAQSVSRKGSFPLCADADGLVTAEGQVALLLKPLSSALRDGNRIRAVIEGVGISTDGKGKSLWAPRSEGQLLAMRRAYPDPSTIRTLGYIEAHATGTQVGDATELQALDSLLGEHLESGERIWVGSLKTNIGHTLETAGLASLVKVVLSMEHGLIPPGASLREPNPVLLDNPHVSVPVTAVPWPEKFDGQGRRSAVNAFGIGGINVHVVLSRGLHEGLAPLGHTQNPIKAQIISADCVLPGCRNKSEFIDRIRRGDSALVDAPESRWSLAQDCAKDQHEPYRSLLKKGGYIQDYSFDWRAYRIPPVQIASANPLQYMFIESVDRALKSCGSVNPQTTAVLVGTSFGGDFSNELQMGLRLPETLRYLSSLLKHQGIGPDEVQDCLEEFEQRVLVRYPALLDETGSFTASSLATRIAKVFNFMGGAFSLDAGEHTIACVLSAAQDLLAEKVCDTVICAFGQRHMDLFAYEGIAIEWTEQSRRQAQFYGLQIDEIIPPGEGVVVLIIKPAADDNAGPILGDIVIRAAPAPQHHMTGQTAAQPKLGYLGVADAAVALLTQVELGSTSTVQAKQAGVESLIQWNPKATAIKGKVAAIFPGQGSQYEDCFKDLVDHSPWAAEVLADLDAMCECMDLPSLSDTAWRKDHLMGVAVWDTQWAVFLSNLLAWRLLLRLGVRVDYLASHSFGEFPMAVAGGALSFRGGALAARARATALEQQAGASGGLVSVLLDAEMAQKMIAEADGQLWISAFNAPRQVVIGGTHEALDVLEDQCHERRIACRRLAVASAFHTPLLSRAAEAFAPSLATIKINPWQIPAFSATTGTQVLDAHSLRSNLVLQLTQPVRWVETVLRLYDEGVRTFIEVGPAGVLSGLVRQILKNHSDVEVIQMDQPTRGQSDDPLETLRQKLAARGLISAFTSPAAPITRGVIERFDASAERRALNRKRSESAEKHDQNPESDRHGHDESRSTTPVAVSAVSPLRQVIIEFVMEHTGYPLDMIDFGVDMEADLGIDSIRKAQLISDLGVRFKVKREAGLSLSEFSCLRDIERFFEQRIQTTAPDKVTAGDVMPTSNDRPIFDLVCVPMAGGSGLGYLLCLDRDPALELSAGTGQLRHGFLRRKGQTVLAWNEAGLILADECLGLQSLPGSRELRVDSTLALESLLHSAHRFSDLTESHSTATRTIHALDSKQGLAGMWRAHPNDFPRTALARFAEDEFTGDWAALIRGALNASGGAQDYASALSAAGRWVAFGWVGDHMRVVAGDGLSPEWAAAVNDFACSNLVPDGIAPPTTQRYALRLMDRPPHDAQPAGPTDQAVTLIGQGPVFDSIGTAARHFVARSSILDVQPESDHRLIIADPEFLSVDDQLPFSDGEDRLSIWIQGIQRWLEPVESRKTKANGPQQAVLAVMNLGGDLGLSGGALNVRAAAMLGLFKGLAKEYPQVLFRVVDIGDKPVSAAMADTILSEFSQPEAWSEVAVTDSACRVIGLQVAPSVHVSEPMPSGETWLVTGGASGITAECAFELAQRRRIKVALVGRTALDIPSHQSGQEALHQDAETRKREHIRQWLARYKNAGLEARYVSCDLGSSEEVERMIDQVEQALGPIRGVIHGAGVEYSARFTKKSTDSFITTARPKNLALAYIVHALRQRDRLKSLRALLAFGSTSGHFGGHGQADYSMANQLLARQIARVRDQESGLRATCIHWHAWDGVGMATRGGIPLILAQFGLNLMPLKEGIDHFMSVLEQENPPAELVITEPALVKSSAYGVVPDSELPELISTHPSEPFNGRILLDPRTQPFLHDHRLDNVPLMPAAMAIELLLQVANRGSSPAKDLCVTEFEIVRSIIHVDIGSANVDIYYDPETQTAFLTQEDEPQPSVSAKLSFGHTFSAPGNLKDPCPFPLYPMTYHESSVLRHGDTLQTLRGTYFDRKGGWAELLSPDPKAVFGKHRIESVQSPVALLDGCFYACGLYAYFLCGQRVERPVGIKRLSIGTLPVPGRICLLRFFLAEQTDAYSLYDFILSDELGQVLLEVSGLRMRCYS